MNLSENEKLLIHQHYGTFNFQSRFQDTSPRLFSHLKTEIMLIKYTVLLLSLIILTLDVKNIRGRISQQEDIISEVKYNIYS